MENKGSMNSTAQGLRGSAASGEDQAMSSPAPPGCAMCSPARAADGSNITVMVSVTC